MAPRRFDTNETSYFTPEANADHLFSRGLEVKSIEVNRLCCYDNSCCALVLDENYPSGYRPCGFTPMPDEHFCQKHLRKALIVEFGDNDQDNTILVYQLNIKCPLKHSGCQFHLGEQRHLVAEPEHEQEQVRLIVDDIEDDDKYTTTQRCIESVSSGWRCKKYTKHESGLCHIHLRMHYH